MLKDESVIKLAGSGDYIGIDHNGDTQNVRVVDEESGSYAEWNDDEGYHHVCYLVSAGIYFKELRKHDPEEPRRPVQPPSVTMEGEWDCPPVCPHCGMMQEPHEYEDYVEYKCDHCNKEYTLWREASFRYIAQTLELYQANEKYKRDYFAWYVEKAKRENSK